MNNNQTIHEWSKDALFSKAQRFADKMIRSDHDDWEFGFWSSLTMEMLIRASLANISPVLVADGKDFNNLLFALGREPNQQKFTPKSAGLVSLLKQVENIYTDFTREHLNFCVIHINNRNREVHSGALAFEGLRSSTWLPKFYSASKVLVEIVDESLENLFGDEVAEEAEVHIKALKDEGAKKVEGLIKAHRTIWDGKDVSEQATLTEQAKASSTRNLGHRIDCPSCNSIALVFGDPIGSPQTQLEEDIVIEKQSMLPEKFECVACGLQILGYSKLVACGLGGKYTSTSRFDAVDYLDLENHYMSMFEEDNNE